MKASQVIRIGDREVVLETGEIATRARSAVLLRSGDTVILGTVVVGTGSVSMEPEDSFVPLTVEYREKTAAVGRIPGSYLRRELKMSDHEILVSRFIDRAVRPRFRDDFRQEVLVQVQVLSTDVSADDAPLLGGLAASAALHLAELPWFGPVAWTRLPARSASGDLPALNGELVVAAGRDGFVMIDGGFAEQPDDTLGTHLADASSSLGPILDAMDALQAAAGRADAASSPSASVLPELGSAGGALAEGVAGCRHPDAEVRRRAARALLQQAVDLMGLGGGAPAAEAAQQGMGRAHRDAVLRDGVRPDGRTVDEVRSISVKVGWLPKCHGSALFTRGGTQASVTCTLGAPNQDQMVETLGGTERRPFMLHYNFPPFSVGEVRALRGPGRREIGHGALAARAFQPVLPSQKEFPFAIRVESDIFASDGSSSMATVCGASLALMDAGVPVRAPVAGVAMGLVRHDGRHAVLTDILGEEDGFGDMDLKVAGTARGITAIQLDNKGAGVPVAILLEALEKGLTARLHILDRMGEVLSEPRRGKGSAAPFVGRIEVSPGSLGLIIGAKGSNIKHLQDRFAVSVQVLEHGEVVVSGEEEGVSRALAHLQELAGIVRVHEVYEGRIVRVVDAGVAVRIFDAAEGWLHISDWADERTERMDAVAKTGDRIRVRVMGVDGRGRLRLSKKAAATEPQSAPADS